MPDFLISVRDFDWRAEKARPTGGEDATNCVAIAILKTGAAVSERLEALIEAANNAARVSAIGRK